MQLMIEVLPAPLGPIIENNSPSLTPKLTSVSARTPPKRNDTLRTSKAWSTHSLPRAAPGSEIYLAIPTGHDQRLRLLVCRSRQDEHTRLDPSTYIGRLGAAFPALFDGLKVDKAELAEPRMLVSGRIEPRVLGLELPETRPSISGSWLMPLRNPLWSSDRRPAR